jgi:hypothetical protein
MQKQTDFSAILLHSFAFGLVPEKILTDKKSSR